MPQNMSGRLGKGTFGTVSAIRDGGQTFACKKYRSSDYMNEGIPHDVLCELALYCQLPPHENIISIIRIDFDEPIPQLIMPVADSTLRDCMKDCLSNRRIYLTDVVAGVMHLHYHGFMHRDIKLENILVFHNRARLADMGTARPYVNGRSNTLEVSTLWYRSVEVILGDEYYGMEVDVWAVGIISVELYQGTRACSGDSNWGQLIKYFSLLGTPTDMDWNGIKQLPHYNKEWPRFKRSLCVDDTFFATISERALIYDKHRRATAGDLHIFCQPSHQEEDTIQAKNVNVKVDEPNLESERILYLDWMCETAYNRLNLENYTVHVAARLLHIYVSKNNRPCLVHAIAALYIASKLNEAIFYDLNTYVDACDKIVDAKTIIDAERTLLKTIGFTLWYPEATCFFWNHDTFNAYKYKRHFADISLFLNPVPELQSFANTMKRLRENDEESNILKKLCKDICTIGVQRAYGIA